MNAACASSHPEDYRSSPLASLRLVGLERGSVWDLIGKDCLGANVSSWTFDIKVAKAFKRGVPPDNQGYPCSR